MIKTSIYYDKALRDPSPFFSGNFTISLKSGFTTTIPNNELSVPHVGILESGKLGITDNDTNVLQISGLSTEGIQPINLGQPFLSAVYMYVNYDNNTPSLWKPARLGASSENNFEILAEKPSSFVPLRPNECVGNNGSSKGPSASAISGIAVGIFASLFIAIGLYLWSYTRLGAKTMNSLTRLGGVTVQDSGNDIGVPEVARSKSNDYASEPGMSVHGRQVVLA